MRYSSVLHVAQRTTYALQAGARRGAHCAAHADRSLDSVHEVHTIRPVLHAVQASSTLEAVQVRVTALAATVGELDAAPPALHRALDALQDTLTQRVADPLPDRAPSSLPSTHCLPVVSCNWQNRSGSCYHSATVFNDGDPGM